MRARKITHWRQVIDFVDADLKVCLTPLDVLQNVSQREIRPEIAKAEIIKG